ncbi:unnamed protein product, partial [Didymodactylos carnosus]
AFKDATVLTIVHRLHTVLDKFLFFHTVVKLNAIMLTSNPKLAFSNLMSDVGIPPSKLHKI